MKKYMILAMITFALSKVNIYTMEHIDYTIDITHKNTTPETDPVKQAEAEKELIRQEAAKRAQTSVDTPNIKEVNNQDSSKSGVDLIVDTTQKGFDLGNPSNVEPLKINNPDMSPVDTVNNAMNDLLEQIENDSTMTQDEALRKFNEIRSPHWDLISLNSESGFNNLSSQDILNYIKTGEKPLARYDLVDGKQVRVFETPESLAKAQTELVSLESEANIAAQPEEALGVNKINAAQKQAIEDIKRSGLDKKFSMPDFTQIFNRFIESCKQIYTSTTEALSKAIDKMSEMLPTSINGMTMQGTRIVSHQVIAENISKSLDLIDPSNRENNLEWPKTSKDAKNFLKKWNDSVANAVDGTNLLTKDQQAEIEKKVSKLSIDMNNKLMPLLHPDLVGKTLPLGITEVFPEVTTPVEKSALEIKAEQQLTNFTAKQAEKTQLLEATKVIDTPDRSSSPVSIVDVPALNSPSSNSPAQKVVNLDTKQPKSDLNAAIKKGVQLKSKTEQTPLSSEKTSNKSTFKEELQARTKGVRADQNESDISNNDNNMNDELSSTSDPEKKIAKEQRPTAIPDLTKSQQPTSGSGGFNTSLLDQVQKSQANKVDTTVDSENNDDWT